MRLEPQLPAKAVLGSAAFTQNSAGSYGGAIINEGDVRFNGPVSFVENTAGKIGGAVCNLNTLNMAAESTFSKNTAGVGGGFYNEGLLLWARLPLLKTPLPTVAEPYSTCTS